MAFIRRSILASTFAVVLSFCGASALPSANVTLQRVTLMRDAGMVLPPSVFFSCREDKSRVPLPVHTILHPYEFMGNESWQPVTQLQPNQCKHCGLYQQLWLYASAISEWTLCPANFTLVEWQDSVVKAGHWGSRPTSNASPTTRGSSSSSSQLSAGMVVMSEPRAIYAALACRDCNPPLEPGKQAAANPLVPTSTASMVVRLLLGLLLLLPLAAAMAFILMVVMRRQQKTVLVEEVEDSEKSQFLEASDMQSEMLDEGCLDASGVQPREPERSEPKGEHVFAWV